VTAPLEGIGPCCVIDVIVVGILWLSIKK
jgi:hypothetical protein